jgi:catalase
MVANSPLFYSPEIETVPRDESDDIERVMEALRKLLVSRDTKCGEFRRDVHVKSHGCASGEFRVMPNLPEELSQGLFERGGIYPAAIRFSNSSPLAQPDALPDGRGMAIQVRGAKGDFLLADDSEPPTQDFIMVNHPTFVARNVKDYLRLQQIRMQASHNSLAALQSALTAGQWNPLYWRWREASISAHVLGQFPKHPASYTYFSMVPIRFGRYVAKYRVQPTSTRADSYLALITKLALNANAMRLALEETLHTGDVWFDFQVQLRTCERTMPIEDATTEWPERESPYRTVAHLRLPRQDLASMPFQNGGDELSFSVWNALVEHRPLGGINRVRRFAYGVSSVWRANKGTAADQPI